MSCPEFEELLDPYFDNELPVLESRTAEQHLAGCRDCRSRYEALQWLRAEINDVRPEYRPSAAFEGRMRKLAARGGPPRASWWWGAGLLAAALALFLLSPGLWLRPERGSQLLDAHLRSLLSSNLVDVPSSDRHTVKPWFQGKLPFSPPVPDLAADGFVLVGGRIEVFSQERTAALVYKRREHIISLFISQAAGPPQKGSQEQGYHLVSWNDRGLFYWAVSDLNSGELTNFTQLFRSRQ